MKTILVTGCNGLVGSELVNQLGKEKKHKVIALSRNINPNNNLHGIKYYTNKELLSGKIDLKSVDVVINAAFSRSNKCEDLSSGLIFTVDLFNYIRSNSNASFINISTQGLYEQPNETRLLKEDDPISPKDCYGVAKQAVEHLSQAIFKGNNYYTNVRLSSVNFKARFTQYFVNSCLFNKPMNVHGAEQYTSLIDVYDVAKGLIALAEIDSKKWKDIYNLGSGHKETVLSIANTTNDISLKVFGIAPTTINFVEREIVPFSNMDISRIKEDTGWEPIITVEKMIKRMFQNTIKEMDKN